MNNIANLMESIEKLTVSQEFLTFTLGDEEYGIDMQLVRELRNFGQVTQIAHETDCIKGVMNLRGNPVPILDLRLKLKNCEPIYTNCTVVIILKLNEREVGIIVDSVSDVVTLKPHQIKHPRIAGSKLNGIHTCGLGRLDNRLLILVDFNYLAAEANFECIEVIAA